MNAILREVSAKQLVVVPLTTPQALDEIGDVNVTMEESFSREYGRAGWRWVVSFTALGYPAHVGEIEVSGIRRKRSQNEGTGLHDQSRAPVIQKEIYS